MSTGYAFNLKIINVLKIVNNNLNFILMHRKMHAEYVLVLSIILKKNSLLTNI